MDREERVEKQERDRDDEDGGGDERFESGEEAIDSSGRNPTQRRIDAGNSAPVDIEDEP
ncbi:MAG: hypothetical protein ACR2GT_13295 [Gaiellaceae bacterium]